jgi:hypothetical protein
MQSWTIFLFKEVLGKGRGHPLFLFLSSLVLVACVVKSPPPNFERFGRYRFRYEIDGVKNLGIMQVFDDCRTTYISRHSPRSSNLRVTANGRRLKVAPHGVLLTLNGVFPELTAGDQRDRVTIKNLNPPCEQRVVDRNKDSEEDEKD